MQHLMLSARGKMNEKEAWGKLALIHTLMFTCTLYSRAPVEARELCLVVCEWCLVVCKWCFDVSEL